MTYPRGDSDGCDRGNRRKPAASAGQNSLKNASKSQNCVEKGIKVPGTLWEGAERAWHPVLEDKLGDGHVDEDTENVDDARDEWIAHERGIPTNSLENQIGRAHV